ncbi:BatD family protein [Mucilaginibacter boryungensis]|uniref:Oxygen tolerance protein BatD n=1 Tax=Mucilaginibacter boryungensis TaxID=768480 RepID=A0ABR9XIV5_9SPHI|nr:BatD family protein [Mucilaginibacter boryungensis]MBE9667292.1 hypothetical protein [Mucilaginibacter boryungensis]
MKQQYFKFLVIALALICCFKANAQSVQVVAKLDSPSIKIGEQTKLSFIVHQPAKERVNFPRIDSISNKITLVSANKADTTYDQSRANITINKSYTITAFDAGTDTIPSFDFGSSGGVQKSNPLILKVITVKVDTTKGFYDIKQPLSVPYTFWDLLREYWMVLFLPLAVILIIFFTIWYFKARNKKEVVVKKVIPDVPLHTQMLNKLNELRAKKLYLHDVKAYHSELSDIIREYLEKRYAIKTHEKTTDEIFTGLKYIEIEQENRNLLRQILLLADLVKFAKEKPLPNENEQSMDNAIAFISNTRQVSVVPPAPTEGGHTDAHV